MTIVPEINLSRFLSGDGADRRAIARETDAICRDIGFLSVTGHGVAPDTTAALYDCAKRFFHQSVAEKQRVRQPHPDVIRGYIGYGVGALGTTRGEKTGPDMKESFSMGPLDAHETLSDSSSPRDGGAGYTVTLDSDARARHFAPNLWPDDPVFRAAWADYFRAMERLSSDMMRLFASALDLPQDHFAPCTDKHISILSAIYYPDQEVEPAPGQLRAGAHTDFGTMTILKPDSAPGGLQVHTKSGEWIAVKAPPGSFVLNIGDLMARWTNDRWVSTLHRVVNPPRDMVRGTERLSIGFFHQPNFDALIDCLPGCRSEGGVAKYAPITSGAHLQSQFSKQVVRATPP